MKEKKQTRREFLRKVGLTGGLVGGALVGLTGIGRLTQSMAQAQGQSQAVRGIMCIDGVSCWCLDEDFNCYGSMGGFYCGGWFGDFTCDQDFNCLPSTQFTCAWEPFGNYHVQECP